MPSTYNFFAMNQDNITKYTTTTSISTSFRAFIKQSR